MVIQTKIKKWGNSVGVVLPKIVVERENLKENDAVFIDIVKESDISDLFGSLKRKMSGQKFKDMAREGWK